MTIALPSRASPLIVPTVVATYPHDPSAFTEGLVFHQGQLLESTGELGKSTLRRVDLQSGKVLQALSLPETDFGEGLALVDGRLIQLTYESGIAHVYDSQTFEEVAQYTFDGQGWGLCFDGSRLIMSNGLERLTFRDPTTFAELGGVAVTELGREVFGANELECVGHEVFANMWPSGFIYRIDARTGTVVNRIDGRGLLDGQQAVGADVLNGIAFDPETGHLLLTGKLWPKVFEVDVEPSVSDKLGDPSGCALSLVSPRYGSFSLFLLCYISLRARRRRARACEGS